MNKRPSTTCLLRRYATAGLMCVVLTSGCASTTVITSRPSSAHVIMDNSKELGKTPLQIREMVWSWTSHTLQFRKKGYYATTLKLQGHLDAANLAICLCTLGLLFPAAFVQDYKTAIEVDLQRIKSASNADLKEKPAINFD